MNHLSLGVNFSLSTSRLLIGPLLNSDAAFILEILNTQEWLTFIGDKKVYTLEDALDYIQKINTNPLTNYYIVRLKEEEIPIGIISFVKRDYLEHSDIGFALLPAHVKKGYAYEASKAVLDHLQQNGHDTLLGITLSTNMASVKMLEKLGLHFEKEMVQDNKKILVYRTAPVQP